MSFSDTEGVTSPNRRLRCAICHKPFSASTAKERKYTFSEGEELQPVCSGCEAEGESAMGRLLREGLESLRREAADLRLKAEDKQKQLNNNPHAGKDDEDRAKELDKKASQREALIEKYYLDAEHFQR